MSNNFVRNNYKQNIYSTKTLCRKLIYTNYIRLKTLYILNQLGRCGIIPIFSFEVHHGYLWAKNYVFVHFLHH